MCPFGVLKAGSCIHPMPCETIHICTQSVHFVSLYQEKGNTPPTETKCASNDPLKICCLYGRGLNKDLWAEQTRVITAQVRRQVHRQIRLPPFFLFHFFSFFYHFRSRHLRRQWHRWIWCRTHGSWLPPNHEDPHLRHKKLLVNNL